MSTAMTKLLTSHRENLTAPHGRPNLRSRLHSCHAQAGGPKSPKRSFDDNGPKKFHEHRASVIVIWQWSALTMSWYIVLKTTPSCMKQNHTCYK